jgi:hypothetical protein
MNRSHLTLLRRTIVSPVGVTFLFITLYLGAVLASAHGDPLEFARVGTKFSEGVSQGTEGYDGQFIYYIARDPDPTRVAVHLDVPAYRYQRILLPMLARVLSFGQGDWLPWVLPAIGLVAHLWAILLLGKLFENWGISRWHTLGYGMWAGLLLALRLDLPEPLAMSLVITAIWLDQKKSVRWAWLFYALALFAKETTIFFIVAQGLIYLANRRWRDALGLSLLAGLPFVLFHLWLLKVFGSLGFGLGGAEASGVELVPFFGLLRVGAYSPRYLFALLAVDVPALLLPALWGLYSSAKRWLAGQRDFSATALFLNAAIYPFLPLSLYIQPIGTLRLASGLVLALLLFFARFRVRRGLNFSFFWIFLNVLLIRQTLG